LVRRPFPLILLLSLSVAPVLGQAQVGSIAGTVKDASGAVLPKVTVTLTSPALIGGTRTATTDENGFYKFFDLKPGVYNLKLEHQGFKTYVHEGIVITSAFQATVNVSMDVGQVVEMVTVSGESPPIDTSNVVNQTVTGQDIIERIPNPRDPWVLARMVPGVQPGRFDVGGTEGMQQYALVIHGSRDSDKKFAIDGLEINWPGGTGGATAIYYDAGMFKEVNYQTGALSAEISQGGVYMNMVTKDGGNDIHGSLLFMGANDSLQGNNVSPELRGRLLAGVPARFLRPDARAGNPIRNVYDLNGNLGGPFIKDKLWWFVSLRQWGVDQLVSGAFNPDGSQAIDDNRIRNAVGKVTWQINSRNKLIMMYNRNEKNRFHRRDTPPFFIDDKASVLQDQPGYSAHIKWTFTPSSKWVIDSGLAGTHIVFPLRYQSEVRPTDIMREDITLSTRSNAAQFNYVNPNYRLSVDSAASYVTSGLGGSHSFKFGIQFMRSLFRQVYNMNADHQLFFDNGRPAFVRVFNTPLNQANYLHQFAWFAQDAWTIRERLTLNLGLRYEYVLGVIPPQQADAGGFIGARNIPEIRNVPNFKDLAPRFGLSWDVRGNGKTVVKASASRYLQNVGMAVPVAVNPFGISNEQRTWTDRNNDGLAQRDEIGPGPGFVGGLTTRMDPELERPYNWEYSLGIQQQLYRDLVVSITGWHRDNRRNIGRANLAVPRTAYRPVTFNLPSTLPAPFAGQPLTVFVQDPAIRGQNSLITNFDSLDSEYNGVDISFVKRLSQKWQLLGGVTIGRDRGAFRGDIINGFDDLNNPNFDINRKGVVGIDAPYQFKLAGTYQLPWGLEYSANLQHLTGYPLRRTFTVTTAHIPNFTQVSQAVDLVERGAVRLPNVNIVDMRISKVFGIGEHWRIQPTLDLFNVGNISTTTAQVEAVGTALGRPATIVAPRIVKLGVKVDF
jgi:hypothetical protein